LWRCCGGSGGEGMVERYAKVGCRVPEDFVFRGF